MIYIKEGTYKVWFYKLRILIRSKRRIGLFGKNNRSITAFSWGLVLAMAIYLVPGMTSDAIAKEAFAEQVFAEEAFAKEVLAQEAVEGEGGAEIEWSQDVFYRDWEGNPLKGPVSGYPAQNWVRRIIIIMTSLPAACLSGLPISNIFISVASFWRFLFSV